MVKRRLIGISTLAIALLCIAASADISADESIGASAAANTSPASSPRQIRRAQRKAERARKKAKLEEDRQKLEQNGYDPSSQDIDTPKAIQDAQNNAAAKVEAKRKAASGATVSH